MKLSAHAFRAFWAGHAWAGIALGLALHLMFLAGAVTLFLEPLKVWEEPIQHRAARETLETSPQILLERGLAALSHLPAPPKRLWLGLPQGDSGVARFQYSDAVTGKWRALWLDPSTSEASRGATGRFVPEREQLAVFLYHLHYLWHPALPELEYLAGLLGLAFLLTIVTGVLIHIKDLARQLTQFRPRANRRTLWSDMHKVLGVMGLPFQLLYSYTGALLVLGPVVLTAMSDPVFGPDQARADRVVWNEPAGLTAPGGPATARSLDTILAGARTAVPGFQPIAFGMQDYGRAHSFVRAFGQVPAEGPVRYVNVLFDHTTGAVLHVDAASSDLASHAARRWTASIHYAYFGGTPLRVLFALLALAACATILTGNWIWLARPRPRSATGRPHLLARLTAGVGAGVFVAIAALFVASRVLPLDAPARIATEQLIFAAALAACIAWALAARAAEDTWWHQLGLAGVLLLATPVLAARLSPAGLFGGGPHITAVVGVDLGLVICGALLVVVAWALRRIRRRSAAGSTATAPIDVFDAVGEDVGAARTATGAVVGEGTG